MQMQTIEHASPAELLSQPTRDDRRVDLDGQVTLHYSDLGDSVTERTQNVSSTGMFIRTSALRPPGTVLEFELDLGNGLEPIEGRAEVVWARRQGDGLFRPVGMGARFIDLGAESRQLISWSVKRRTRELRKFLHLDAVATEPVSGRGRSDLGDLRMELEQALGDEGLFQDESGPIESSALAELRAEVDGALQAALESSGDGIACEYLVGDTDPYTMHPYAGCASVQPQAGAASRLWRLASAVPLVPLAALALYLLTPVSEPASAAPESNSSIQQTVLEDSGDLLVKPPVTAPESAVLEHGDNVLAEYPVESDVEELVGAWAEAWSEQRARAYLALYAPGFQPPGALDRELWEASREERILKPRHIRVEVRDLETEVLSPERARVSFAQTYRSDRYRDTVRKTLDLVRAEQGWRILAERSEPAA